MNSLEVIKWAATATLIIGTVINSMGIYPAGPCILIIGGCLWLYVSVAIKDTALIATNSSMVIAALLGLLYNYIQSM